MSEWEQMIMSDKETKHESEWGKCSCDKSEALLLEPKSSLLKDCFRVGRVLWEIVKGFKTMRKYGPCVTVFGSARIKEDNDYYLETVALGKELANAGFSVLTGGGPGLMEAANKGAKEAFGTSIGCNIRLPMEQKPNPFLDDFLEFNYFFTRKLILAKYSYAFIATPGGYGTLDEMFEVMTLIQTGKMENFPIVLLGKKYWSPLISFIEDTLVKQGTVSICDLNLILITDSAVDAVNYIRNVFGSKLENKLIQKC